MLVHLFSSTTRGCSVEGCEFMPNLIEWAIYFMPPLIVTAAWWRWRRQRNAHAA
jgi:hypothetical protein